MSEFIAGFQDTIAYVIVLMPALTAGAWVTAKLFFWTLILSLPLGLPIALGSNSRFWPIKAICQTYVFIFRGTPLILQLYFFYFFLPIAYGITLSPFVTSVITFVLNYAAYFAEIYRGGINGIDRGQYEASQALGLSKVQSMFGVIFPQTVRVILPSVSNEAIVLIKDTALASIITVGELMKASRSAVNRDVDTTAYIIAAAIYLAFTFVMTLLSNYLERKYSKYDVREVD